MQRAAKARTTPYSLYSREGEHRPAVAYTIDDAGLGEVVRLEGAQPREAVGGALRWADLLLHSAVSEGFCVAALEAQATGLPVVCTDAGGLPENVADGETVAERSAALEELRHQAGRQAGRPTGVVGSGG